MYDKNPAQALPDLLFPGVDLAGMGLKLLGDLVDRALPLDHLQGYLGFEFLAESVAFHFAPFASDSILTNSPVFGGHFTIGDWCSSQSSSRGRRI